MDKPQLKTRQAFDYHECERYIEYQLGYKLGDTLGRWDTSPPKDVEYRDFWHFLCDRCNLHNGSYFNMKHIDEDKNLKPWQLEIINAFYLEFGEDATYWVDW